MKTILTSSIVVAVLALGVSGCGGSSSTKKVYLDSNSSSHQVGTSSTDSGSRESSNNTQNNNIDRVAINISSQSVQNLHLSTSTTDYKALSISGEGRSNFIILSDGDVYPKNDIANGEYSIIIHAKATDSTETIDKELIVEVTGSSIESSKPDPVVTPDPVVQPDPTGTAPTSSQIVTIGTQKWLKVTNSNVKTFNDADATCKNYGWALPTYSNFKDSKIENEFFELEPNNINLIIFWTNETDATKTIATTYLFDKTTKVLGSDYNGDISADESHYFTCVPSN